MHDLGDDSTTPRVPISIGELLDKISILEVKAERIADSGKRANVLAELTALDEVGRALRLDRAEVGDLRTRLRAVNGELWDIEDAIRECERRADFGEAFVGLARSVYRTNDERAALKRLINELAGSRLVEEKSYAPY
jgi:hypothetical protein